MGSLRKKGADEALDQRMVGIKILTDARSEARVKLKGIPKVK
jgi:hypothetical protein